MEQERCVGAGNVAMSPKAFYVLAGGKKKTQLVK